MKFLPFTAVCLGVGMGLAQAALSGALTTVGTPSRPAPTVVYQVTAGGRPVRVYDLVKPVRTDNHDGALVNPRRPLIAAFEVAGKKPVAVAIRLPSGAAPQSVVVRPLSAGIRPTIKNGVVRFTVARPIHLDVEIDGTERPLFLFADPHYDAPKPGPGVTIVGPGETHTGNIDLEGKSDQTVYLAPGSVLAGALVANHCDRLRIYGPGIVLSGPTDHGNRVWMRDVRDVTLDGPVLVNNLDEWTAHILNGSRLTIRNLKIVSAIRDGLDLDSCDSTTVDRAFVYSFDDSLDLKSVPFQFADGSYFSDGRDVKDIRLENSTVWQCGGSNALKIDDLDRAPRVHDILWRNIDVIHKENTDGMDLTSGVITIWNQWPAKVENIVYRDIRIEDVTVRTPVNYLIDLRNSWHNWGDRQGTGDIKDITFDNVSYLGVSLPPSALIGNANAPVSGIRFSGLRHGKRALTSSAAARLQTNEHAAGVTFRP